MTSIPDEDLVELYEHAPCGYLSMLPGGEIVKCNETLLGWLGLARDQVLGRPFQDLLTAPGRIFHDTHYMPLLVMQGFAREISFDLSRPDGPPLHVMVTTQARRDASGDVIVYRTTVFDSSARRSYERELLHQRRLAERAATAKAALLAMISHDIRSPMSAISMATEALASTPVTDAQRRYIQIVTRGSTNVLELVDAMLEHSRLEAGAATWQPQPTDLRELIEEIAAIHSVKADAKHVSLHTEVDPAVPPLVFADRFKLGQIITNLMSNAIKFTEQGRVFVEAKVQSKLRGTVAIDLSVSDTGIGIPSDKLEKIFDEYDQGDDTTARRYGGSGLGLAISRKLAALAGSTITVESRVGQGSTFHCALQLSVVDPATEMSA